MTTAARTQPVLLGVRVLPVARAAGGPSVTHWIASTSDVARDGGIIEARGWELDEFLRSHPSILWCHDWQGLPLGSATKAWVEGEDLHFHMAHADHEFADTVRRMVLSDPPHIRACSVGFDILADRKPTAAEKERGARWVATKTRLNEISLVPVPADPGAVFVGSRMRRADAKVIRSRFHLPYWETVAKTIERTAMKREVKTTEDGMLVAEIRPAADFVEGSFESMAWETEGVSAVVGTLTEDESVAIQGVEFDAEAFDADTAQAWLDENEEALLEWRGEAAADEEEEAPPESDEEMSAEPDASRDQIRAVVERVREAAISLGEAADDLETLVDGEADSKGDDDAARSATTYTTSGTSMLDDLITKINALERQVQDLSRARSADGAPAARSEGAPDVEDSYGLLDAANKYAGV